MADDAQRPLVTLVDSKRPGALRQRAFADYVFGRRLASDEEDAHKIGPATGVPVLGLDALGSAAYGP